MFLKFLFALYVLEKARIRLITILLGETFEYKYLF